MGLCDSWYYAVVWQIMSKTFSNGFNCNVDSKYYVDACSDYAALKRVLLDFVKDPDKEILVLRKRGGVRGGDL